MNRIKLGHALATAVLAVASLNTLSALSMPVADRKPALGLVLVWLGLLCGHASAYRWGDAMRERFGLGVYAGAQATLLFAIAVSRAPTPVTLVLFAAAIAELVVLAGAQWGTIWITVGAIAVFVLASLITSDLYRATTAGMLLAATGLIAHAIGGLLRRPHAVATTAVSGVGNLSPRETDVLRQLVEGTRNSDIASALNISERTVKAHLGSIYQKLGVETRAAAVAAAIQRKLV